MIKLIIFDLDGVLVDIKKIHFESLNQALREVGEEFVILESEHISLYDGLKTSQKLSMLTQYKGLPESFHHSIWENKQRYTIEHLQKIEVNENILNLVKKLSDNKYKIACCSNSIKKTILTVLKKLQIINYFDFILSNEDVKNSKPHPEMYWKAISEAECLSEETLILEDSPYGLLAAQRSQSHVLRVRDSSEVVSENIFSKIKSINTNSKPMIPKWVDTKLNVLIPMAGAGTALIAKELINNDNPLFFANSDQYVDWNSSEFMYKMQETNSDGGIVTFSSTHPKWSYAKVDENGLVTEVAEKNPISDKATIGYYFWKNGSDFVKYAERMIEKDIRVNKEFYVCPVFNQAIEDKKKVMTFHAENMWGLGTPEDLNYFLENYNK